MQEGMRPSQMCCRVRAQHWSGGQGRTREPPTSWDAWAQDEAGIAAHQYHAGMTPRQRVDVQNRWRHGGLQVVVATIAFGMGERSAPHENIVTGSLIIAQGWA